MKTKTNHGLRGLAKICLASFCLIGLTALLPARLQAQSIVTNADGTITITLPNPSGGTTATTSSNSTVLQGITQLGKDAYASFKDASFANGFIAEPFGLYHKGDFGGGISVSTPGTNSINYGFALAVVQEKKINADGTTSKKWDFYDTSFNVSYNGDTTLPVLGHAQYFAETGAAVDLGDVTAGIYNQTMAGVKKTWDINGNLEFSIWGGPGYLSKWNDVFYAGGISITDRLKGTHFFGLF